MKNKIQEEKRRLRKKEIKEHIAEIREKANILDSKRHELLRELDFLRGHFDKTWEEEYLKNEK